MTDEPEDCKGTQGRETVPYDGECRAVSLRLEPRKPWEHGQEEERDTTNDGDNQKVEEEISQD